MTLSSITTPAGIFTIAAFDHRGSLTQMFGVDPNLPAAAELLTRLKILFMDAFSPMSSAALVDPLYGFPAIERKAPNCGLILTLEASGYTDERAAVPTMIPNWGVENVKNNYAVAKLLVYFHPGEANAAQKKKIVNELGRYCQQEGVVFLVEPVIFNPAGKEELSPVDFQEAQLLTAQEFQQSCDVLKLQYPGDALGCATLTAELDVPWILLSRGMPYDKFREALKVSMENGAEGFAAGRSVWQEIGGMKHQNGLPDYDLIERFLHTTGTDRMQELIDIAIKAK